MASSTTIVLASDRLPWDQQEGETVYAYRMFMIYLSCGMGRTPRAAYKEYRRRISVKQKNHPDQDSKLVTGAGWTSMCVRHRWIERSAHYDTWDLKSNAKNAAANFARMINEVAKTNLRALKAKAVDPRNMTEVLDAMTTLAALIPREVIAEMLVQEIKEEKLLIEHKPESQFEEGTGI